jgi:hypothetical protein
MLRHILFHRALPATLLLISLAAGGRLAAQRTALPPATVLFDNSTIDPVRVYLIDNGAQWLLGRVDGMQVALLKLPPGISERSGEWVSLVAVPLGARGVIPITGGSTGVVRSEPEPGENLLTMRWRLADRQLFSVPKTRFLR